MKNIRFHNTTSGKTVGSFGIHLSVDKIIQKWTNSLGKPAEIYKLREFDISYCFLLSSYKRLKKLNRLQVFDAKTNAYLETNNNTFEELENPHQNSDCPLIPPCVEGKLSDEVVKQQFDILFIAGHDTTASTIAYAALMMAMHPKIQDQVFNELNSIYSTQNEDTTYAHTQKCAILDRVVKETMRLFPSVYLFSRTPRIDIPLKNCVIPKGSTVALPVYTMHRVIRKIIDFVLNVHCIWTHLIKSIVVDMPETRYLGRRCRSIQSRPLFTRKCAKETSICISAFFRRLAQLHRLASNLNNYSMQILY